MGKPKLVMQAVGLAEGKGGPPCMGNPQFVMQAMGLAVGETTLHRKTPVGHAGWGSGFGGRMTT